MGMTINGLVFESHDRAKRKGFWEILVPNIAEKLCLIHSEVSEALEDYREHNSSRTIEQSEIVNGKPVGFASELADIIIRVCDLAGHLGIDLEKEIRLKSDYNETRGYKHGKLL